MVSDCFPEQELTHEDVLATWAGVRPLIREEGKSTRDTSREDAVWHSPPGLISVAGGKLTTYRKMAEECVERKLAMILVVDKADPQAKFEQSYFLRM